MTTPEDDGPRPAAAPIIRHAAAADIDQILRWRATPEVTRWLIETESDPERLRRRWFEGLDDPDAHYLVAEVEGAIAGYGSMEVGDGLGQRHGELWQRTAGHLGYLIDPQFAGNGYATAIARALLELAFTKLGVRRVTAGCFADNRASWRVMEKLGMRREEHGVKDSWHAEYGWIDGYTYAILADEWQQARPKVHVGDCPRSCRLPASASDVASDSPCGHAEL